MTVIGARELGESHDCKVSGCTNETTLTRGPYAYLCDEHRQDAVRRRTATTPLRPSEDDPGYAARVRDLTKVAAEADRTARVFKTQLQRTAGMKREADEAAAAFKAALLELAGEVAG